MISLKCLIINRTQVNRLPPDIKNLMNLVMMSITFTQTIKLPLEVFKLEKLIRFRCAWQTYKAFFKED